MTSFVLKANLNQMKRDVHDRWLWFKNQLLPNSVSWHAIKWLAFLIHSTWHSVKWPWVIQSAFRVLLLIPAKHTRMTVKYSPMASCAINIFESCLKFNFDLTKTNFHLNLISIDSRLDGCLLFWESHHKSLENFGWKVKPEPQKVDIMSQSVHFHLQYHVLLADGKPKLPQWVSFPWPTMNFEQISVWFSKVWLVHSHT